MPLKIVRNDITKMKTEAIVNTANRRPLVGTGCDYAIYQAAGRDTLLRFRQEKIGVVEEGEVFLTPGFALPAKYIIHAVSPYYTDGNCGEEEKLRSCYRKSLELAQMTGIGSIAFPLISTGGFHYPKEEGLRIAVDEINAFLLKYDMLIYLVVFDEKVSQLGKNLFPDLEFYIDQNYVDLRRQEEYSSHPTEAERVPDWEQRERATPPGSIKNFLNRSPFWLEEEFSMGESETEFYGNADFSGDYSMSMPSSMPMADSFMEETTEKCLYEDETDSYFPFSEQHGSLLEERMRHLSDTFSQYLLYLIQMKNMGNAEVYKRAIVDKKIFSKIKNNPQYHPQKLTALCLCVGAKLNLDESKDLLARAGYALSPCDKTDIIFSYFIENQIYDMIELDIQLEEHGLPCVIC